MKKIKKPKICYDCPVFVECKKTLKCNVAKWEIKKGDKWEIYKKWVNCPIDWDK